MSILQALIFDVDGTLAETEEWHREAFNAAFAAAGLGWVWDQALYARLLAVTGGKERMAHYQDMAGHFAASEPGQKSRRCTRTRPRATPRAWPKGVCSCGPACGACWRKRTKPACAWPLPQRPAARMSMHCSPRARPLPSFDVIAAGDEVARKKPAPDIYDAALARLGLPPERAWP